jgi:hypothetical protein
VLGLCAHGLSPLTSAANNVAAAAMGLKAACEFRSVRLDAPV